MRTGFITFLRNTHRNNQVDKFVKDQREWVAVHNIGIKGGFEIYPSDNTMEGELAAAVIVEFKRTGEVFCFELGYEVSLTFDK